MSAGYSREREALVKEVEGDERELGRALERLRAVATERIDEVRDRFDLGRRIAARPGVWLAAGFALGLWLGWEGPAPLRGD